MYARSTAVAFAVGALFAATTSAGVASQKVRVPLNVPVGTPLRIYLTKRVWYRKGEAVQGKFAQPVWSFDRIVIPMGTIIRGKVSRLQPVPRMVHVMAMVGGNFTPLKIADISFSQLILPDGKRLIIQTRASPGLPGIYAPPPRKKRLHKASKHSKGAPNAKLAELRRLAHSQMNSQLDARTHGFWDFVRGRNRREWLEDFLLDKLPYRPQWYRKGTLFNAVLSKSLHFGTVTVTRQYLQSIGTEPGLNATARVRLLATISSAHAHVGDPIECILATPVFGTHHRLILPVGTRVTGKVTLARHALLLHRGGKLRFIIQDVRPPRVLSPRIETVNDPPVRRAVQAQLISAEADPKKLKINDEGDAKATESKSRLLRPLVAALVATKSMDNDAGKRSAAGGGTGSPNAAGLSLGGFSGFGGLGALAFRMPSALGSALGFYGLGWSVYTNLIARGSNVAFPRDSEIAIRFGNPPPEKSQRLIAGTTSH